MISRIPTLLAGSIALSLTASTGFAQLPSYSEDFEALDIGSASALGDAGWLVFANVFDGSFNYLYGYGPFPAPNGGPGFCAIATGQGGTDQGAQQIVTYSDYNNGDHGNGFIIEANVFQEFVIDAADVGRTMTFQFDGKLGDILAPSTSIAFIKILDSNTFGLDAFETVDTTAMPTTWSTFSLSVTITADHVGDFFQIGFASYATNFNQSGQFYDNVSLFEDPPCGTVYCDANQNPANAAGISVDTCEAAASSINVTMNGGPSGQFAYLLVGDGNTTVSQPPGAVGDLCVAGGSCLGRYATAIGTIDGAGSFNTDVKAVSTGNPSCPNNVQFVPGATWNFQYWHRQASAPATFSAAISVTFN